MKSGKKSEISRPPVMSKRLYRVMQDSRPIDARNSNGQLVTRFVTTRDQAAFAMLVRRLGPMVRGVARRLLSYHEDADDVTQLAFAELARRAGTIENPDAVGGWLHTVTVNAALRLRQRRPGTEPLVSDPVDPRLSLDDVARRSDLEVLSEELDALPEQWREPLLLRYFSGLSNEDAAEQLGTTVTALEGRLKRGKQSLRVRLIRRGVSVASVLAVVGPVGADVASASAAASIEPPFDWDSVTDAAQDLASDPSTLTFLPPAEPTTMTTTILTFKAALATGSVAVVAAMLAGPGHDNSGGNGPATHTMAPGITTAVADDVPANTTPTPVTVELGPTEPSPTDPFADDLTVSANEKPSSEDPFASNPAPTANEELPPFKPRGTVTFEASEIVLESDEDAEPTLVVVDKDGNLQVNVNLGRPTYSPQEALTARPRPVEWIETPLDEVAQILSNQLGYQVALDLNSLEKELGFSGDTAVNLSGSFPTFADLLNALSTENGLEIDYVVRGEKILLMSEVAAGDLLSTRRYDLPSGVEQAELLDAFSSHAFQITSPRGPVDWPVNGFRQGISVVHLAGRPTLLVTQSDRGHEVVEEFLELLTVDQSPETVSQSRPEIFESVPATTDSPFGDASTETPATVTYVYDFTDIATAYNAQNENDFSTKKIFELAGLSADRVAIGSTSNGQQLVITATPDDHAALEKTLRIIRETVLLFPPQKATNDPLEALPIQESRRDEPIEQKFFTIDVSSLETLIFGSNGGEIEFHWLLSLAGVNNFSDVSLQIRKGNHFLIKTSPATHDQIQTAMQELITELQKLPSDQRSQAAELPSFGGGGYGGGLGGGG